MFLIFLKMMNAILVLRINLIEIEKVNELCNDFSDRYVEALKIKLNSDNIFKIDEDDDDLMSNDTSSIQTDKDSDTNNFNSSNKQKNKRPLKQTKKYVSKKLKTNNHDLTSTPIKRELASPQLEISPDLSLSKIKFNMLNLSTSTMNSNLNNGCSSADNSNQSVLSNGSSNDLDVQDEDTNSQYLHHKASFGSVQNSSSTDDVDNVNENSYEENEADYDENEQEDDEFSLNVEDDACDDEENENRSNSAEKSSSTSSSSFVNKTYSTSSVNDDSNNSKTKRGVLPKSATNVMKKWLFQHIVVS